MIQLPFDPGLRSLARAAIAAAALFAATGRAEEIVVFKKSSDRELRLSVDKPANWKAEGKLPAVVYFFGGGWVSGSPDQFAPQSEYFASRGIVGIRAEYRTIPKGEKGPPLVCIQDAKSALRYARAHAAEFGIDPDRIAAAGGSAGGHLAAATALLPGLDDPNDDLTVSPRPNALILFNPVLDNGPGEWGYGRVGAQYKDFSPAHHVDAKAPPTIVFLGEQDKLIPVKTVQNFAEQMRKSGVRCEAHFYPGVGHGFFNKRANDGKYFRETVAAADQFLASLGWLHGPPTIKVEAKTQ